MTRSADEGRRALRRGRSSACLRGLVALVVVVHATWCSSRRRMPPALLPGCSTAYSRFLAAHPLPAKSLTAGLIFAGADATAQKISGASTLSLKRVAISSAVGLFVFGPSAHLWFAWIFRLIPGNSLLDLLMKTALGQIFFGPYITVVFFAAALWGAGQLSWKALRAKVKADLWPTIFAGLGFWPLADFIAFALLSEHFIPPFLNMCSFVW
eukprot:CAMPEP_0171100338 /NCGR_PEP_ID=MMETSP0766_2-20121228/52900_1 /TAXON_ID=439317 /ORGANISM="Gambierdiscus australes, Strain CAWD 149" /LENGTH=210 /DNA_ID=CAMNT_0011560153 /DNA_START=29 /DNA_END=658 /DNA_ORIENTATION=+